jgi:hypothetical protein
VFPEVKARSQLAEAASLAQPGLIFALESRAGIVDMTSVPKR